MDKPPWLDDLFRHAASAGLLVFGAAPLYLAADLRLKEWLAKGYAGDMKWFAKYPGAYSDPCTFYSDYCSVISLALPYAGHQNLQTGEYNGGVIARYAVGDDYHEVFKERLFQLVDTMRREDSEFKARVLVDTAPLLEKSAASAAGLGWQGKNTNVLRKGLGSYFFLGEILVDRPVPKTQPAKDHCGICTRCLTSCPTNAFPAPYVLDARRCISYLTIEHRGVIPLELRPLIGRHIFGCDICQEVCPWNRFAVEAPIREFRPRPAILETPLSSWLTMDEVEWRRIFRRSAVRRVRYSGFLRNVAVALGNTGTAGDEGVIVDCWNRVPTLVQQHLTWALRVLTRDQSPFLSELHSRTTDPGVSHELSVPL